MSLDFKPEDEDGDNFMTLFSESEFTVEKINDYLKALEEKMAFETNVNVLVSYLLSPVFQDELKLIIGTHFSNRGDDVVNAALEAVTFDIHKYADNQVREDVKCETAESHASPHTERMRTRHNGRNNGVAQRYAYNLIKGIIEKNPNLSFRSLYNIFRYKNYIENIDNVSDETRWCMDDKDIIKIADGTRVVISNQWGFNNNCKVKMDRLREIASKFGLDTTLP